MSIKGNDYYVEVGKLLEDAKNLIHDGGLDDERNCVAADAPEKPDYCSHCRASNWMRRYRKLLAS